MSDRDLAFRWLEEKGIKHLLRQIVDSLLDARPDNPESHIIQFLQSTLTKPPTPEPPEASHEVFPTLGSPSTHVHHVSTAPSVTGPRRASLVSQKVLTTAQRRKAMSSKMTSSTTVEIRVVPKDPATTAQLLETVNKVELFSFLQSEPRQQLVDAMFEMQFADAQIIIRQGDPPDNFYILADGDVSILKKIGNENVQVAVLHPGACFGELALISGSVRTATVVAIGPVKCWAIDQTTYLGLLKERHAAKRQRYKSLLKQVPALQVLPEYEILLVADALQPVAASEGEVIVKQGERGDEFFIILEGQCKVWKIEEDWEEAREVAVLEAGGYFGELALLNDMPRAATVIASMECKLIKLDRASFHRLLGPLNQIFTEHIKSYSSAE